MDALEFYIGELEAALNRTGYYSGSEKADALSEAARNVITAWDAENAPDDDPDRTTDLSGEPVGGNPRKDSIIRVVNTTLMGTYRVVDPYWGLAQKLSDGRYVQINWDAVEWEYES